MMNKMNKIIIGCLVLWTTTMAFSAEIHSITSGRNANGNFEVQINGTALAGISSFSLNNPARIVVDIPNGRSLLSDAIVNINQDNIADVAVIEGDDRVRATISLSTMSPYRIIDNQNRISVVVEGRQVAKQRKSMTQRQSPGQKAISKVDFRRGANAQGRVEILLPNDDVIVDVDRRGRKVVATLRGGQFGQPKKLNVMDFGTPVKTIDVYKRRLMIRAADDYFDLVSYQNENKFFIELNKPEKETVDQSTLLPGDSKKKYTGEPLSLNFQDIEVRAVLQLIGDFTDTNIVVSDEVAGSITLRLNNVPWDQALDIILQTKGLSKQQNGDVIYIAPSSVIAKNKQDAYAVANVEKELAPLQQQLIPIKFARAENIEKIIEDNSNRSTSSEEKRHFDEGLLSSRGSVSVDTRTNTLIVNDVASSIDKVIALIERLDTAVDQVLIDSRIVTATNSFAHEIGIRWGGSFVGATDSMVFAGAGNAAGANTIINSANNNIATTGQAFPVATPSLNNRLGVNLGAASANAASLGLSVLGSDFLLDLELSALEDDGRGEVISSPRVITQDGHEAIIRQGRQYGYRSLDDSGNTVVKFKDIDLRLKVTPKIAPNRSVDMILEIDKDSIASITSNNEPLIDTNGVRTQVLVESGETIVLGGVYEQQKRKSVSKVPVLGDLPIVGRAFRKDKNEVSKSELLIFVTPKIIDKRYISSDKFSEIRN